jgi:CTP:molybdopterin cytidylyltransferase MocA
VVTIAGLVLAAGAGTRIGRPKASLVLDGERFVDRAVRTLTEGGCTAVVVVSGAQELDVDRASVVDNPDWPTGMGSSLRRGLATMPEAVEAVVILLVDTPLIGAEAVRRLISAGGSRAGLAVATYGGRRGHPVLLGREHWPGAGELARGDEGARPYLNAHPDQVLEVPCDGTGDPTDVDTEADVLSLGVYLN